jgi:hypothetical protein
MQNEAATFSLSLPEPAYKASGNIFDEKNGRSTLPMAQHFSGVKIEGSYTETDRKLWLVLVYLAFDKLHTQSRFEANLRDIARVFREVGSGTDGIKWLIDSIERLGKTSIRWTDVDGWDGLTFFISGLKCNRKNGEIIYNFDPFLVEKLIDNKEFARLRIRFTLGLSGKYTLPLYMLLEGLVGREHPHVTLTIEELRQRINVPEGKLIEWKDFRKFALDPAIDKINEGSGEGGVIASYRTESKGRKIESVTFTAIKTPERLKDEVTYSRKISKEQATEEKAEIRPFTTKEYEGFKQITRGLDVYSYEQDWREWCSKKDIKPANHVGHFIAFLMRKAKPHQEMLDKKTSDL